MRILRRIMPRFLYKGGLVLSSYTMLGLRFPIPNEAVSGSANERWSIGALELLPQRPISPMPQFPKHQMGNIKPKPVLYYFRLAFSHIAISE